MALMMNTTTQVTVTPEQETAFKQFLTDCIEEHCRDGYYIIYWDYRDEVSPDTINKAFFDYVDDDNGYCNFEDYLDSTVFDEWSLWDYEHYLIEEIESDANNSDDFIQEILQNINEYNQAEVTHMLDCMEDSDVDYDFYREYLKIISEDPANKQAIIADTANRYQEWLDYDCNERSSKDIEEIFCDVIRDWMI